MNVNAHHYGRRVRALPSRPEGKRLPPAGELGRVVDVESHGHNPWTLYGVRFDESGDFHGLAAGSDFEWVHFPTPDPNRFE